MTGLDNSQKHSFRYLENLIRNSNDEVTLDSDIILSDDENSDYIMGIEIDEDIVINGNNHKIDGKNASRIFNISQGNVTFRNIIFKNAFGQDDGSAIMLGGGSLKVEGCEFIANSSDGKGAGIFCSPLTRLRISDSRFFYNSSNESACLHNFNAIIEIRDTLFCSNSVKENASVIINQKRGRLSIWNSTFRDNDSKNGGSILNFGKCELFGCLFKNNFTSGDGAAISNQERSLLNISDTSFIGNECDGDGGAIVNFSRANFRNLRFLRNFSKNHAAALSNQKSGSMKVSDAIFSNNRVDMNGGAIINWGNLEVKNASFKSNSSVELGGAIFNQEGSLLKMDSGEFIDNYCVNSGGAIFNWGEMHLEDMSFKNNESKVGGAINTAKRASTIVHKSSFHRNISKNASAIFNNSKNTKLFGCEFSNHGGSSVVYNFKSLVCADNIFHDNSCGNIIFNDEGASLSILGGEFKDNSCDGSLLHNIGEFSSLARCIFRDNSSQCKSGGGIYNESYLVLYAPEFSSSSNVILNRGTADIKKMDPSLVHNLGILNDFSKRSDNKHDFSSLNKSISENQHLTLERDYRLEIYESDFYEGGIEIISDGLEIDGGGHTIDGASRSRIFIINAKKVVLKNIVFKNGAFFSEFDNYFSGGGAIHVLKDASLILENCLFADNRSNSNGGAIFNDGCIRSVGCRFINNRSKTFGGAVDNKRALITRDDEFRGNASRIAGAIYNRNYLEIEEGVVLEDNDSQFIEGIYNAGLVQASGFDDSIFDSSKITKIHESKSFLDLMDEIETSKEIKMTADIIFDFRRDYFLKYRLDIKHDLVIDGAGHAIEYNLLDGDDAYLFDGANSSSLFRIRKKDVKLTLKNIIFRNCYSNGRDIIDNSGELVIENCRFINSRIIDDDCLINNRNVLKISDSNFSNIVSSKRSIIDNSSKAELSNVSFINNNSMAMGSCITNSGEIDIEDSLFKSNNAKNNAGCIRNEFRAAMKLLNVEFAGNDAEVDGGAIYNYGEIDIGDSKFVDNLAGDEGGAINTRTSGEVRITNSEFISNESKTNGGAIFNYGKVDVSNSRFIGNRAKNRSGAIEHTRPLDKRKSSHLKVSNCEFKENRALENDDIYSYDGADVEIR